MYCNVSNWRFEDRDVWRIWVWSQTPFSFYSSGAQAAQSAGTRCPIVIEIRESLFSW